MKTISAETLASDLTAKFAGTRLVNAWGETSLFYNPNGKLPRGVYFATVKSKDGDNDKASNLDRYGVFRLNVGTTPSLFLDQFGTRPARPAKGCHIDGPWDFTALDTLTPHPVYGWMSWISILNPSAASLTSLGPMIDAAYQKAATAFDKRIAKL